MGRTLDGSASHCPRQVIVVYHINSFSTQTASFLLSWLRRHVVVCSFKLLGNLWIESGRIVAIIPMLPIFSNHFLNQQHRRTDPNLRVHPYGSGKGKGKDGKSKGKGLNSLPAALREHGTAVTSQGHALCFGYSLKNCRFPVKNGRCQKGLHLCCYKGCFKNHPYLDCPKLKEAKSNE